MLGDFERIYQVLHLAIHHRLARLDHQCHAVRVFCGEAAEQRQGRIVRTLHGHDDLERGIILPAEAEQIFLQALVEAVDRFQHGDGRAVIAARERPREETRRGPNAQHAIDAAADNRQEQSELENIERHDLFF